MSDKIALNLKALIESINKIKKYSQEFTDGEDFYHDEKSFDATMMQFVVIGEVITRLDEEFKTNYSNVPWQKIKDFRNIIAHDYFGIDADEIWSIIKIHLIPLEADIVDILKTLRK